MALIPFTLPFEIVFAVLAFYLAEKGEFGRWIGVCIWPLLIALITQVPNEFFSDASGSVAVVSVAWPVDLEGFVTFIVFLFWIWSMVDIYYYRQMSHPKGVITGS
jgi:acetyltransferase-like isoleucine patch superfamily enzyme